MKMYSPACLRCHEKNPSLDHPAEYDPQQMLHQQLCAALSGGTGYTRLAPSPDKFRKGRKGADLRCTVISP